MRMLLSYIHTTEFRTKKIMFSKWLCPKKSSFVLEMNRKTKETVERKLYKKEIKGLRERVREREGKRETKRTDWSHSSISSAWIIPVLSKFSWICWNIQSLTSGRKSCKKKQNKTKKSNSYPWCIPLSAPVSAASLFLYSSTLIFPL